MYRALYAYSGTNEAHSLPLYTRTSNRAFPGALSCTQDDLFYVMGKDPSEQWLQVASEKGDVGYLPANYLQICPWADETFSLKFIDESIANIYAEKNITEHSRRERLRMMFSLRSHIASCGSGTPLLNAPSAASPKGDSPASLSLQNSQPSTQQPDISGLSDKVDVAQRPAPQQVEMPDVITNQHAEPPSALPSQDIEPSSGLLSKQLEPATGLADRLVDSLSEALRISADRSREGVASMLSILLEEKSTEEQMREALQVVSQPSTCGFDVMAGQRDGGGPAEELLRLFEFVREVIDDSQQRSWHLHDDLELIHNRLSELLDLLTATAVEEKWAVAASVLSDADATIQPLVLYYQMETRSALRRLLLQIFAALCTLSERCVSFLLCSVLPLELKKLYMCDETGDEQLVLYSAILLSMIFSTGESLPITHTDALGADFIDYVLDVIECDDATEKLHDVSVELLLSFNLHEPPSYEQNTVLQRLAGRPEASRLTQRFLYLFNRAEDPVAVIEGLEQPNSLLKFANDLYSNGHTSQILYTNDLLVLIDVILRQISNLSLLDQERVEYLMLMENVIAHTDYLGLKYKRTDLLEAINSIEFMEETGEDTASLDSRVKDRYERELSIIRSIRGRVSADT